MKPVPASRPRLGDGDSSGRDLALKTRSLEWNALLLCASKPSVPRRGRLCGSKSAQGMVLENGVSLMTTPSVCDKACRLQLALEGSPKN